MLVWWYFSCNITISWPKTTTVYTFAIFTSRRFCILASVILWICVVYVLSVSMHRQPCLQFRKETRHYEAKQMYFPTDFAFPDNCVCLNLCTTCVYADIFYTLNAGLDGRNRTRRVWECWDFLDFLVNSIYADRYMHHEHLQQLRIHRGRRPAWCFVRLPTSSPLPHPHFSAYSPSHACPLLFFAWPV